MSNPTDGNASPLESRQKVMRELEDIQNSLVAASQKVARLQMETEGDHPELQEGLDGAMNGIGSSLDGVKSVADDFSLETNRLQNEG